VTAAAAGHEFAPIRGFTLVGNYRAAVLALVICALLVQRRWLRRCEQGREWVGNWTLIFDIAVVLLGFELLTVETVDCFRHMAVAGGVSFLGMGLTSALALTLAGVWMVYSVVLTWIGLKGGCEAVLAAGLCSAVLGVVTAAIAGYGFAPIERFTLAFNYRAAILVLAIAVTLVQRRWLGSCVERYRWIGDAPNALDVVIAVLGLELMTVEAIDYFGRVQTSGGLWLGIGVPLARVLALAAVWAWYSFPMVWYGFRRRWPGFITFGFGVLALGVGSAAVCGLLYQPIEGFSLILNVRAAAFALVIAALIVHLRFLARRSDEYSSILAVLTVTGIVTALLVFELATAETWDVFGKAMCLAPDQAHRLASIRQMMLSVVWLVYSVLVMGYGFWRRAVSLRFLAIAVFGITILKVFLSDLSFLETLYRIFSFIALGLILLATSYLYQRFKDVILGVGEDDRSEGR